MEISISPIAFLSVRWYGIMVALAVAVIIMWVVWQVRKGARISYDDVFTAALVGIPSGIVFSRLLHVIDNIIVAKLHPEMVLAGRVTDYMQHPGDIIGGSGLTIYGAILGAALGIWVYSKFTRFQFGYIADIIAPGLILAQVIGRGGCLINGCSPGVETSLPWAITYTHPKNLGPLGIPTHPTVVYEMFYLFMSFGVALWLKNRLKPDGSLFLVYLSLYALWRLASDSLRVGTPFLLGLHQAQFVSIIVLTITIPLLVWKTRWVKAEESSQNEEAII